MGKLICQLAGARGRYIKVYDTMCVIHTAVTAGSILSGNATDGEKTIYYVDCTGVQFKESGATLGYLQLETPSMQMNNQSSNFFSENTFTFEEGRGEASNRVMRELYNYITKQVEYFKYAALLPGQVTPAEPPVLQLRSPMLTAQTVVSAPPADADWICSCGFKNKSWHVVCQGCGSGKSDATAPAQRPGGDWMCTCGLKNKSWQNFCIVCGSAKPTV